MKTADGSYVFDWQSRQLTRGDGPESYTLRLVASIGRSGVIVDVDKVGYGASIDVPFGSKSVNISKRDDFYIFRITGFDSEIEAQEFSEIFIETFKVSSLSSWTPVIFEPMQAINRSSEYQDFRNYSIPETGDGWPKLGKIVESDGTVYAYQSAILPEHEKIVRLPENPFAVWSGRIDNFERLQHTFDLLSNEYDLSAMNADEALRKAFNAYSSAYSQNIRPVMFQNLVSALECLAPKERNTSKAEKQARERLLTILVEEASNLSFEELSRFRKKIDNISQRGPTEAFRNFVTPELIQEACPDISEDYAKSLSEQLLFGIRSKFAHEGFIEAPTDYHWAMPHLQKLVPYVLQKRVDLYRM